MNTSRNLGKHALFLFMGMLLCSGSLFACKGSETYGTVAGQLVDAREYNDAENNLSEQDQTILHRAAVFGPHLVLIEDGSRRVRPFYAGDPDETVENGDEQGAEHVGKHVSVSGCMGGAAWPFIQVDGEIHA